MEELLELSRQIVIALDVESLTMTEDEREQIDSLRESVAFFLDRGNYDRAIQEAKTLLNKLNSIKE